MRAIEIFGCSGGMAEGFRRAGIIFDFAFDYDADACASYEANLGRRPIQMDVRDLVRLAAAGWSPGPLDLLVADPPCTPWSRAGKRRGLEDGRDMLISTCELIRHLRPKHFLIGNVPGLDDGPSLPALRRTIGALSRLGYCIDYKRLNAASYGVPQHRVRPFWYGHLAGPCIGWPAPTHEDPERHRRGSLGLSPLAPWLTLRDALGHLSPEDLGRPVTLRKRACNGKLHGSMWERPARVLGTSTLCDGNVLLNSPNDEPSKKRGNGGQLLKGHPRHPVGQEDSPAPCIVGSGGASGGRVLALSEPAKRAPSKGPQSARVGDQDAPGRTLGTSPGRSGGGDSIGLSWPWDRPSTTLQNDPRIPPPGHHESGRSMANAIVLSERAALIIQGFPENWVIVGKTAKSRWGQLGMAMPPPLAKPVATSVLEAMRC